MTDPVSLREALDRYQQFLESSRLSALTKAFYLRDVRRLLLTVSKGVERPLAELWTDRFVAEGVAGVHGPGTRSATIRRMHAALRHFEAFCIRNNLLHRRPARTLPMPPIVRACRLDVSREEFNREIDAMPMLTERDYRDRAAIELLIDGGMKVSELVVLPTRSFDREARLILIRNHNGETRQILLSQRAAGAVAAYLDYRLFYRGVIGPLVFPGMARGPISVRTIQRGIGKRLRALAGRAGCTPQTLRACCATWMMDGGATRSEVQEFLGLRARSIVADIKPRKQRS